MCTVFSNHKHFYQEIPRQHLNQEKTSTDTGTSWETAYGNNQLQLAINTAASASEDGNQYYVAIQEGTYYPGTARGDSFSMKNNVVIIGGFLGKEKNGVPVGKSEKTILSGNNISYHVFYHANSQGLTNTAELRNVTITGGNANLSGDHIRGGGMFNGSGNNPVITGCYFTENKAFTANAFVFGGGMHNKGNPQIIGCTFKGNIASGATGSGGGLHNENGNPVIIGCTFIGNSAYNYGGGMLNENGNPTIIECNFTDNLARLGGGGMTNIKGNPTITGCTFTGNIVSSGGGGGLENFTGHPTITGCTFTGNKASNGVGGGIYATSTITWMRPESTVLGNTARKSNNVYPEKSIIYKQ